MRFHTEKTRAARPSLDYSYGKLFLSKGAEILLLLCVGSTAYCSMSYSNRGHLLIKTTLATKSSFNNGGKLFLVWYPSTVYVGLGIGPQASVNAFARHLSSRASPGQICTLNPKP